jgi:hypothetical protein
METIETRLRDIFNKQTITESDVKRANTLMKEWKRLNNWQEATSNPIKAY